jgi:hypothetical protein
MFVPYGTYESVAERPIVWTLRAGSRKSYHQLTYYKKLIAIIDTTRASVLDKEKTSGWERTKLKVKETASRETWMGSIDT